LNFGGGGGALVPAGGFDEVGVVVGEFERGGALFGDIGQRRDGAAEAEQQAGDPAP
jgi:hypothetical protein